MDEWRTFLYPLGFLSALAFGARFIIQWLESEKAQKSTVSPLFWKLSLLGNLLLMVHSFIQIQYHVCIIQACNGVISWRNLNLMQFQRPPKSLHTVIVLLIASIIFLSFAFVTQDWLSKKDGNWFRIPIAPWQSSQLYSLSMFWHAMGFLGYLMFSSRFWVQWVLAEKGRVRIPHSDSSSYLDANNPHEVDYSLPLAFWWLSLGGAVLSITYFLHIRDSVNLIGPLLGFLPYFRNLMLIYKRKQEL